MSSCLYLKYIERVGIHFTWQNHIDFDAYLAARVHEKKNHISTTGTVKNLLLLNTRKTVYRLYSLTMAKYQRHANTLTQEKKDNKITFRLKSNYNFHSTLYHVANQNKFARNFDIPLSFICFSILVQDSFTPLLLFVKICQFYGYIILSFC